MTEDIQMQQGQMMTREVDEKGERTVCVLTKPDAVQDGELGYWQEILLGQVEALRHGYYCVKNPSTKDLEVGITYEEARAKERLLFQQSEWLSLPQSARARLGTENLLTEQIRAGNDDFQAKLAAMPAEFGEDEAISHVDKLCRSFAAELSSNVDGSVEHPELIQTLRRQVFAGFRDQILLTVPIIVPADKNSTVIERARELYAPTKTDDLAAVAEKMDDVFERGEFSLESGLKMSTAGRVAIDSFTILDLSDIHRRKIASITRELPGTVPYAVKVTLMRQSVKTWRSIAEKCIAETKTVLLKHLDTLIERHFGQYEASSLKARVKASMRDKVKECGARAFSAIMQLLSFEESVDTANHHYFTSTREKVLEALKARRAEVESSGLNATASRAGYENEAISLLCAADYKIDQRSLTRLLPEDAFQEELELGAEMLAFWKVAYKRVIDLVPGMLDILLARKLAEDAFSCIYRDLGVQQKDAMERCVAYLQEDDGIVAKRNELKARRTRLQQGLEAIRSFETRLTAAV